MSVRALFLFEGGTSYSSISLLPGLMKPSLPKGLGCGGMSYISWRGKSVLDRVDPQELRASEPTGKL